MVPFYVLSVPVAISIALLFGDSLRRRGIFTTFFLFVIGFIFFEFKENMQVHHLLLKHQYQTTEHALIFIGKVPVGIILGHLFALNVSWGLAERILAKNERTKALLYQTIVLIWWITSALSYSMEITGTRAGWWTWQNPTSPASIYVPPAPIMTGWPVFIVAMILPYFLMDIFRRPRSLMLILLWYVLFYAGIWKDAHSWSLAPAFLAAFVLGVFSSRKISPLVSRPADLAWRNLPGWLGGIFDHALEISVALNIAVIVAVQLVKTGSPFFPFPVIAWFTFCLFALFPLPATVLLIGTALIGLFGILDPTGHHTFSMISLFMGLCFLMAPQATKAWRIFFLAGSFVWFAAIVLVYHSHIPLPGVPEPYNMLCVLFAACVLWFLLLKKIRAPAGSIQGSEA